MGGETGVRLASFGPADLTPGGLADVLTPYAVSALREATPEIRARLLADAGPVRGRLNWAVAGVGIAAVLRRAVMGFVLRVVFEVALGVFAPKVAPFLVPLIDSAIDLPGIEQDETVRAYLFAVRSLLGTPPSALSGPARVGIANPCFDDAPLEG